MKVITFSRNYPATHSKKGQPTNFVEKIWLWGHNEDGWSEPGHFPEYRDHVNIHQVLLQDPKRHTIRGGTRWKVGDQFSPRVWSGKPYASKQVEFAPPITIRQVWTFEVVFNAVDDFQLYLNGTAISDVLLVQSIARNDGLSFTDFLEWFGVKKGAKPFHFAGQILCWNPYLNYEVCI